MAESAPGISPEHYVCVTQSWPRCLDCPEKYTPFLLTGVFSVPGLRRDSWHTRAPALTPLYFLLFAISYVPCLLTQSEDSFRAWSSTSLSQVLSSALFIVD